MLSPNPQADLTNKFNLSFTLRCHTRSRGNTHAHTVARYINISLTRHATAVLLLLLLLLPSHVHLGGLSSPTAAKLLNTHTKEGRWRRGDGVCVWLDRGLVGWLVCVCGWLELLLVAWSVLHHTAGCVVCKSIYVERRIFKAAAERRMRNTDTARRCLTRQIITRFTSSTESHRALNSNSELWWSPELRRKVFKAN